MLLKALQPRIVCMVEPPCNMCRQLIAPLNETNRGSPHRFETNLSSNQCDRNNAEPAAMPAAAVREGLAAFAIILGTVALLATVATACWFLLFHFALKKLPPVQEALGLKKRDKPSLSEKRRDIDALKAQHRASMNQRGSTQPTLSPGDGGVRTWRR